MTELTPQAPKGTESVPFWRDIRVLGVLAQIAFLIVVITGFSWVVRNVTQNMSTLGGSQFLCADGTSSFRCALSRSSPMIPATPTPAPCWSAR